MASKKTRDPHAELHKRLGIHEQLSIDPGSGLPAGFVEPERAEEEAIHRLAAKRPAFGPKHIKSTAPRLILPPHHRKR